uniref:Uncharacterized protein n=1 Tax=Anguilla anguilla TaxID=7936 RepID=A0A0E9V2W3_ANGAN
MATANALTHQESLISAALQDRCIQVKKRKKSLAVLQHKRCKKTPQ